MSNNTILGVPVEKQSKNYILEQIKKYIASPSGFMHIVSLNPENLIIANENKYFKKVIETAQIRIIDGIGIVLAGQILNIEVGTRLTGVDLMKELIEMASSMRLRVILIGGKHNLADTLAKCYSQEYPEAKFKGVTGIRNIKKPTKAEEKAIFSIVTAFRPQIIIASFGSPEQELWLDRHKSQLKGIVCIGVGGAFNYLSHEVVRAPLRLRQIGGEWLFRLITQPWRWRRQLRLVKFLWLLLNEKFRPMLRDDKP